MNSIKTLVRPRARHAARSLRIKPKRVPFSAVGIVAVLCCPIIFSLDVFSDARVPIGVLYMMMLALLSNEKNILLLLFTTLSSIMMLIDFRLFYGQAGTELAIADKLIAIPAMWVYVSALIRHRGKNNRISETKILRMRSAGRPVCNIKIAKQTPERVANTEESKTVFRHICSTSGKKVDPYTRDLVVFLYEKTKKN